MNIFHCEYLNQSILFINFTIIIHIVYLSTVIRPLLNGLSDDKLMVEVWDFDPAETIGEKMSKILEIKGVRGFRKLMKEIALTASTGKHDNELIGGCSIPLRVRYEL